MTLSPQFKGYAFALLATVAGSTVYIFSKAAPDQVIPAQYGVYGYSGKIKALFCVISN